MKIRTGFVTNSSSTNFMITNKTDKVKTLLDFVKENPDLLEKYIKEYQDTNIDYDVDNFSHNNMVECAKRRGDKWTPKEKKEIAFGDEDGDLLGRVFDYMLRDGGDSPSFCWRFKEWLR